MKTFLFHFSKTHINQSSKRVYCSAFNPVNTMRNKLLDVYNSDT